MAGRNDRGELPQVEKELADLSSTLRLRFEPNVESVKQLGLKREKLPKSDVRRGILFNLGAEALENSHFQDYFDDLTSQLLENVREDEKESYKEQCDSLYTALRSAERSEANKPESAACATIVIKHNYCSIKRKGEVVIEVARIKKGDNDTRGLIRIGFLCEYKTNGVIVQTTDLETGALMCDAAASSTMPKPASPDPQSVSVLGTTGGLPINVGEDSVETDQLSRLSIYEPDLECAEINLPEVCREIVLAEVASKPNGKNVGPKLAEKMALYELGMELQLCIYGPTNSRADALECLNASKLTALTCLLTTIAGIGFFILGKLANQSGGKEN